MEGEGREDEMTKMERKDKGRSMTTEEEYYNRSLEVLYEEERYGPTKRAILCMRHFEVVQNMCPNARGVPRSQYAPPLPKEMCEACQDLPHGRPIRVIEGILNAKRRNGAYLW
jgi:hypothetical protein